MNLLFGWLLLTTFFHNENSNANLFGSNFTTKEYYFSIKSIFQINYADTAIIMDKVTLDDSAILISDKFSFTEGPTADSHGNIFFTDQPNDQIWEYDVEGKLTLFMEKTGRSNGMNFDKKGNIISCADENNQLWSISPKKEISVLVNNYEGQTFNGPNDVWVNPVSGGLYFTDPYYQRDYWTRKSPEIKKQNVYYLKRGKAPAIVDSNLIQPNGIIGTADGKYLYVADIAANKTYKYTIAPDGTLKDRQLFTNHGSDGMTIDNKGNIYLTGNGVTVYNIRGEEIEHIPIPARWTANVTFGGKQKNQLFITATEAIYVLNMKVTGVD